MMPPSSPKQPSLVVVFGRLGPYHVARLRGAAEVMARAGVALQAIAIAGNDKIYAWDRVPEPTVCPTRVLFPQQLYEDIPAAGLARQLYAALDEIQPLAVALPGWAFPEARIGLSWCRKRKQAAILMSESSVEDHVRLWPRELLKQRMVRQFGAALVGGRRHHDYAVRLGIPKAAIFGGYDAVDNDYFQRGAADARQNDAALLKPHGLPARYLLTSSRFVAKKNLEGLLRAYALYVAASPQAVDLVVCGDGDLRPSLEQVARELGLAQRIHWPGFVQYPDLPMYYALADAFIVASTTEQWGLVVNEAMACGLPVLVSVRCGCAPELVREGENGFTFDPYQVEAIANALLCLPGDPALLRAMGQRSQEIIKGYDVTAFGRGLLEAGRMALARTGCHAFGPPEGAG